VGIDRYGQIDVLRNNKSRGGTGLKEIGHLGPHNEHTGYPEHGLGGTQGRQQAVTE